MRKRLWQLHSWLGLIAGLGLLIIGLSGSLLVFHDEIDAWLSPEKHLVTPTPEGRMSNDALLASVRHQLPEYEPAGWTLRYDAPGHADQLYLLKHHDTQWYAATLDPYTGRILSSPETGHTFTSWMLELHYTLMADHVGILVVGLFGLLLMLLGVTGVWLYRGFWKNLFTLRLKKSARILFSDIHKFVGITSVGFNLVLGFTGAYWNLPHGVMHLFEEDPPQPVLTGPLIGEGVSLAALEADAANRIPGFRANYISLPSDPDAAEIALWGSSEPRPFWQSPYGSHAIYDPSTGANTTYTSLAGQGIWARIVDSFRPLHFGDFGGLPIKFVWAFAGLTPAILALSGFTLWWLRRPGRRTARQRITAAPRATATA